MNARSASRPRPNSGEPNCRRTTSTPIQASRDPSAVRRRVAARRRNVLLSSGLQALPRDPRSGLQLGWRVSGRWLGLGQPMGLDNHQRRAQGTSPLRSAAVQHRSAGATSAPSERANHRRVLPRSVVIGSALGNLVQQHQHLSSATLLEQVKRPQRVQLRIARRKPLVGLAWAHDLEPILDPDRRPIRRGLRLESRIVAFSQDVASVQPGGSMCTHPGQDRALGVGRSEFTIDLALERQVIFGSRRKAHGRDISPRPAGPSGPDSS